MAAVRVTEVRTLLDLYRMAGDQRDDHRGSEAGPGPVLVVSLRRLIDASFETQLILEDEAAALRTYQPNLVPGLLQTERTPGS